MDFHCLPKTRDISGVIATTDIMLHICMVFQFCFVFLMILVVLVVLVVVQVLLHSHCQLQREVKFNGAHIPFPVSGIGRYLKECRVLITRN